MELHKDLSFKRIFIYAHDNGVTALMMDGAEMAGISMPSLLDVNALPRFKQKFHKDKYAKSFNKLCMWLKEKNLRQLSRSQVMSLFTLSVRFSNACDFLLMMKTTFPFWQRRLALANLLPVFFSTLVTLSTWKKAICRFFLIRNHYKITL